MSKKLLAVIALVVASLFVFTACGGEDYKFDALENNPAASATVYSNGGSYVQKGEYSYFINGAEDGAGKNTFGDYHKGSIVRVKTSDLTKKDRVVETVVPKIIYAEDASSSGLYIFGDKIYYTTPNNGKDAQGNVLLTELDFMVANIDGTGTQKIATIEDNTQPFRFVQKDGKVYILYVGVADVTIDGQETSTTAIYEIDCESKAEKLVADNVDTVVFDSYANSTSVAYTQKVVTANGFDGKESIDARFNKLCQYTAGSESAVVIANGDDAQNLNFAKYTPVVLNKDVVYFNSTLQGLSTGDTFNKAKGTTVTKLADGTYTNVMVSADSEDVIFTQDSGYITKVAFTQNNLPAKTKICAETADIKFEIATDKYVYYSLTEGFTLHRADYTAGKLVQSVQAVSGQMKSTLWSSYDFAVVDGKMCAFYFNDADNISYVNYMYINYFAEDDATDLSTYRIGLLSQVEQDLVVDNQKDDKGAVEDFLAKE
ncbi:MAG: hypothetical protein IJV77_01720 [Clostridia bacterium]|nr:hypothetical protein [Clostridia bacterium]